MVLTDIYSIMTKAERKLISILLNLAADEFGKHGCNDFNLIKDGGLTKEEAKEIFDKLNKEMYDEPRNESVYTFDWLLMRWFAKKFDF